VQNMPPAPVPRTLQLPQPAPLHARSRVAERHVDRRSTACRPALSSVAVSMAEPVLSPTTDAEPQRHKVAIFVVPPPSPPRASVMSTARALAHQICTPFSYQLICASRVPGHAIVSSFFHRLLLEQPVQHAWPRHAVSKRDYVRTGAQPLQPRERHEEPVRVPDPRPARRRRRRHGLHARSQSAPEIPRRQGTSAAVVLPRNAFMSNPACGALDQQRLAGYHTLTPCVAYTEDGFHPELLRSGSSL